MHYNITPGAERSAPTVVVRTKADLRNEERTESFSHFKTAVEEINHYREVALD